MYTYTLPTSLPSVDFLPGPFLLLIFIPLLPLALFSLGARPPTGSSFDFLTDELWRTTALLGVAVTVGLCVGVYPESIKEMGVWLMDGDYLKGAGAGAGGVGVKVKGVKGVVPVGRTIITRAKPSFDRIARNHITALRYYYPRQYNPSTPKPSSVLILGIIITLSTIVITGKILQGIYESDKPPSRSTSSSRPSGSSSKPSAWVSREYEARKKESGKPEETKARYEKEEAALSKKYEGKEKELKKEEYERYIGVKSKERKKDLESLKKMLVAKKLEPIGLEKVPGWYVEPNAEIVTPKDEVIEETKTKTTTTTTKEVKVKTKVKKPGQMTMADRVRNAILGKTLAESRKRERAGAPPSAAAAAVPARGPGWEVADPTSGVVLAQSAGNAEALARGMGR